MKRILPAILALIITVLAACEKDDTKKSGIWTLGDKNFDCSSVARDTARNFIIAESQGQYATASICFIFKTLPVSTGTYRIVGPASAPGDRELAIAARETNMGMFMSTGGAYATVTIDDEKINISVESALLEHSGNTSDSRTLTASIQEK